MGNFRFKYVIIIQILIILFIAQIQLTRLEDFAAAEEESTEITSTVESVITYSAARVKVNKRNAMGNLEEDAENAAANGMDAYSVANQENDDSDDGNYIVDEGNTVADQAANDVVYEEIAVGNDSPGRAERAAPIRAENAASGRMGYVGTLNKPGNGAPNLVGNAAQGEAGNTASGRAGNAGRGRTGNGAAGRSGNNAPNLSVNAVSGKKNSVKASGSGFIHRPLKKAYTVETLLGSAKQTFQALGDRGDIEGAQPYNAEYNGASGTELLQEPSAVLPVYNEVAMSEADEVRDDKRYIVQDNAENEIGGEDAEYAVPNPAENSVPDQAGNYAPSRAGNGAPSRVESRPLNRSVNTIPSQTGRSNSPTKVRSTPGLPFSLETSGDDLLHRTNTKMENAIKNLLGKRYLIVLLPIDILFE